MKRLIDHIRSTYTPLQIIIGLGILFRLLAVVFAKGFGWFDDHFLIIEASQSWVDGFDYNYWLPSADAPDRVAQGHPLFYVGIHYYIFKFLKLIGLYDPQAKMMIIRFLHAAWSLLLITYGYKITEKLSNKKTALYVAAFLSLFWFMPFLSVRNLVEFVCIPPLFIATWLLLKKEKALDYIIAGVWLGIAFSIRFQALFYAAGIGIALLIYRTSIKNLLLTALGFAAVLSLTQGLIDYIIWHKPFAEFMAYVQYNIDNATVYGNDVWHMYFDLILGLLIPPLSFLLFAGWLSQWKKLPILFWPVLVYLAFHTYFPNKQERFVVTILPTLIIAGTIGMFGIYERYKEKIKPKTKKGFTVFVLTLNTILLFVLSLSYSKRNRVESMYYFYRQPDFRSAIIEDSNKDVDFTMPPLYYCGKWYSVIGINKTRNADTALFYYKRNPDYMKANYVVFLQAEHIDERVAEFTKRFPGTSYVTTIEPSMIDKFLHWLNPFGNDNQTTYIYKIPPLAEQKE
ncbi:MAG: glycosyltransferase family 39 protein [Bacteroidia bacterium]